MKSALWLLALALVSTVLGGCNTGTITEGDTERMRKEFSQENYEKNMKAMGKEKELEEEKRRNEAYLRGGGQ